jgi:hypothetical protein
VNWSARTSAPTKQTSPVNCSPRPNGDTSATIMLEWQREGMPQANYKYEGRKPTARPKAGQITALAAEGMTRRRLQLRALPQGQAPMGELIVRPRSPGQQPEQVGVFCNLLNQVSVVSDGYNAIASSGKFSPDFSIAPCLQRIVMDRAVAEHADIRRVEEIRDATDLRDGALRLLRQPAMPLGKHIQEATLQR